MVTSRISIFSGRALFISFLFLIIFLLLIARLLFIKFYQNEFLDNESNSRFISERPLMATRGSILDRNDKVLAFDVRSYTVGLDLSEFQSEDKVVEGLSRVLNLDKNSLKAKIDNKKGYIELKKHISSKEQEEVNEIVKKGIYFQENLRRSYPQKNISAHVVGMTDTDRRGLQGVELVLNEKLKGLPGKFIRGETGRIRTEAKDGETVKLTIDVRLQSIAYEELKRAVNKSGASSGSVLIIDTTSADILALTNFPSFNPSNRKNVTDVSIFRNRATIDSFEPGSVIKPLAMSAILKSGKINSSLKVDTNPGWIEIGGYRTNDFKNYGVINPSEIISNSSNVGMIKLCTNQDSGLLMKNFSNFGLGKYPNSVLIPSREGFLPLESELKLRDKVSACYGYGLSVTALQIAQAYLVFTNEGLFKELNLFLDEQVESLDEEIRVLSNNTTREITKMLVQAVHSKNGTARRAKVEGVLVAGKTGTALQEFREKNIYTATFAGFTPAFRPKILAVVVLHGLEGEDHSGGLDAAPVFSKVVTQTLNVLEMGS